MWLKLNPDGTPSVEGKTKPYCYHIDQFSELQPIIHKVIEYAGALGLDMIQGDHEDAPGQVELNFGFDRAELTADNLTTFRQVCKAVGRELGAFPCFMPKPFMGVSANGCHTNLSLWKGDDEPVPARGRQPAHAVAARPERDRRHPRAPARADVHHGADGELLPALLGAGLLGAGVRRLGLPEPHHRPARVLARPVRVPLGRRGRQPVSRPRRADHGDGGRHQPARSTRAIPRRATSTRRSTPASRCGACR